MPTYEVELTDGRTFQVDADAPPSEQDVLSALGSPPAPAELPPEPNEAGAATAAMTAARAVPEMAQGVARFAANHPAATQKVIGAGITTAASGTGAAIGGVPGAVVGASIRGVTPPQSVIRETAGRWAGETPTAARSAGRAVGAANYAKETYGLPLKPTDMVSTGEAARAVDKYVDAAGLRIPRVLDQYGKVVIGPEALPIAKAPGMAGRLMTKGATAMSAIGKVLAPLQGATAMTDLAQAAEPNRNDIGVMGIGWRHPDPTPDELKQVEATNNQKAQAVTQQQAQVRARVLALLGMR